MGRNRNRKPVLFPGSVGVRDLAWLADGFVDGMENAEADPVLQERRERVAFHLPHNTAIRLPANIRLPSEIDFSLPVQAVVSDLEAISGGRDFEVG